MTTGERLRQKRIERDMTLEEVASKVGITRQTLSRYETGKIRIVEDDIIEKLAAVLLTTPAYLKGWSSVPLGFLEAYDGDEEAARKAFEAAEWSAMMDGIPVARQSIPLLGHIHAGEPTFAEENFECYVAVGANVRCDFALRVEGDSMINARIMDGDIVFIRKQDTVADGEIAAVLIDDETTLKRVRFLPGSMVMLMPENPKYQPILVGGENETRSVRILGKAVAFQSDVR